jgi:ABC-type phosphate transport system permease subunit
VLPIWMTASALAVCVAAVLGLIGMIVFQGVLTFWPRPVVQLSLTDGSKILGIPVRSEKQESGRSRALYRVGNRDLGELPFRWVDAESIADTATPEDVVLVERREWGIFIGRLDGGLTLGQASAAVRDGAERRRAIERLRSGEITRINRAIRENRQNLAAARLTVEQPRTTLIPPVAWAALLAGLLGAMGVAAWAIKTHRHTTARIGGIAALLLALAVWVERPAPSETEREETFTAVSASLESEYAELLARFEALSAELRALEEADGAHRLVVRSAAGVIAPESQSSPGVPMRASQVTRLLTPNAMTTADRLGVYLSRWREFVASDPREANTEGGVFPVIIGTTVVTLLLTLAVVPLGVIAAIYLREYATQGLLVSALRIAINNLAGVPSIVYGVFGLGFFCYGVGGFIDGGPGPAGALPLPVWWILAVLAASLAAGGVLLGGGSGRRPAAGIAWAAAVLLTLVLIGTSPYFQGFFRVKLLDGEPTFGSSGLLWASLTLALLTLPVVIVATEEAIAAVPPSLREGSYGCGASTWQTIRRVVMPGAMPGVLTGAILAMARGAGEVAPLMVVGAVKLAPELPVEARFPFVFADRSFMHLGFHIYDLAFQSPDSEAARGMVWTTTLLLIVLVVAMNLTAVLVRARIRAKLSGGHF